MKKVKFLVAGLAIVFALGSAFTKPLVASYWFDTSDVFQAGPSEPSTEIARINQPELNLSTTQGHDGELFEKGYTSINNGAPAGTNNQNLYSHP